jgi:hypothetical protein
MIITALTTGIAADEDWSKKTISHSAMPTKSGGLVIGYQSAPCPNKVCNE